jgi:hypothetical protein
MIPPAIAVWLKRACAAALIVLPSPLSAQFVVPGPELRLNGFVFAVESDGSGNVYLGGSFNDFNGDASSGMGLLRLTPGGVKHTAWDIGFIDTVNDLLVHGGFLYVGGGFSTVRTLSAGTLSRPFLLRVHLSGPNEGKVDTTWVPVLNGAVSRLETDGTSLFVAGSFSSVNGTARGRLAKILTGGADPDALDASWNPAPNNPVADLEFASPYLYVSGGFNQIGGVSNNYLARLSTGGTGNADAVWLPDINRPVGDLEAGPAHLYFGGDFTQVEGINHRSVGRYSTAAGPDVFDSTWKPDPDGEVTSLALAGSDLYIAGVFTKVANNSRQFMAKVSAAGSGTLSATFLPNPNGAIRDLKVVAGNPLAVGRFNTTNGAASAGYAMFHPTSGAAIAPFAGTISTQGVVYSMQPVAGGMIIGGLFDSVGGIARTSIARINDNGTLDTTFNVPLVGFNRLVSDIKLDGSQLYFCGDFLTAGGAPTQHVARVSPTTGAVDAGWFTKPLTPILCLETDANHVYLGSAGLRFIEVSPGNALPVYNLARVSKGAAATADTLWTPVVVDETSNPANAAVYDLQIHGGNLIVGGNFAFVANPNNINQSFTRISAAALTTTGWGEPVAGWGTSFLGLSGMEPGSVTQLLLHNNALYVGGDFTFVDGLPYFCVAKLDPTTGAWDSNFDSSPAVVQNNQLLPGSVTTLAAAGSHLYIGGDFDFVYDWFFDEYYASPDIVRVDDDTGWPDFSWYPYPNDSVSRMAFAGDNLWLYGPLDQIGDMPVEGLAIVKPFSTSYQGWLVTHFSPAQIANSDFTAPWQDLDGDGDSNLVESFFNTDPFDAARSYHIAGTGVAGLPLIRREVVSGQTYLTIEFTRWKSSANAGVAAVAQFGDNLASWPRSGVLVGSPVSVSTDRERVKFRDSVPVSGRSFGRVEVLPSP